jgi:hypothetical protein
VETIAKIITENDAKATDRLPLIEVICAFKRLYDLTLPENGIQLHSDMQQVLTAKGQQSALKHLPSTWRRMSHVIKQHSAIFERECGMKLIEYGNNLKIQWLDPAPVSVI